MFLHSCDCHGPSSRRRLERRPCKGDCRDRGGRGEPSPSANKIDLELRLRSLDRPRSLGERSRPLPEEERKLLLDELLLLFELDRDDLERRGEPGSDGALSVDEAPLNDEPLLFSCAGVGVRNVVFLVTSPKRSKCRMSPPGAASRSSTLTRPRSAIGTDVARIAAAPPFFHIRCARCFGLLAATCATSASALRVKILHSGVLAKQKHIAIRTRQRIPPMTPKHVSTASEKSGGGGTSSHRQICMPSANPSEHSRVAADLMHISFTSSHEAAHRSPWCSQNVLHEQPFPCTSSSQPSAPRAGVEQSDRVPPMSAHSRVVPAPGSSSRVASAAAPQPSVVQPPRSIAPSAPESALIRMLTVEELIVIVSAVCATPGHSSARRAPPRAKRLLSSCVARRVRAGSAPAAAIAEARPSQRVGGGAPVLPAGTPYAGRARMLKTPWSGTDCELMPVLAKVVVQLAGSAGRPSARRSWAGTGGGRCACGRRRVLRNAAPALRNRRPSGRVRALLPASAFIRCRCRPTMLPVPTALRRSDRSCYVAFYRKPALAEAGSRQLSNDAPQFSVVL